MTSGQARTLVLRFLACSHENLFFQYNDIISTSKFPFHNPLVIRYYNFFSILFFRLPGRVAQLVTCLATDASLTADPGVASSIPTRSHTFVEIDHEMISKVILLPSAESFKKGCCKLQAKVCA